VEELVGSGLLFRAPGGGFLPFTSPHRDRRRIYREMAQAPADGYQQELVLDADFFLRVERALL
jgi:hypothetical protein